jgi:peptide/nickel transport system substrate-binding protein
MGGRVTELLPLYPRTLNPLLAETESEGRVASLLFEGLMELDPAGQPPFPAPVPALAASMDISSDGLAYTFRLRPGLRWHDGSPLTAADVVWTYELLRDPALEAPLQAYARRIREVRALDQATVRFTLTEPYAPFLARLATVGLIPRKPFVGLSGRRLRERLFEWARPVGAGPFRLVRARPGESLALAANERNYRGRPRLDGYSFRVATDPAAVQQALTSGEADLAWLPPAAARDLSAQDFLTQSPIATPVTTLLVFNLEADDAPALRDPRVRRALAHALNLDAISAAVADAWRPAGGFPPLAPMSVSGDDRPYRQDPDAARRLLDAAGWKLGAGDPTRRKAGRELSVTLYVNRVLPGFPSSLLGGSYAPAAARIAADWKAVGVETRVREEGWETFAPRLFNGHNFDAALLSVGGDADPDGSYLWATEARSEAFNAGGYSHPRADALLAQGLRERDPSRRLLLLRQLRARLTADAPAVPIGVTQTVLVQNNRLAGPLPDYWAALQHSGVETWRLQGGR